MNHENNFAKEHLEYTIFVDIMLVTVSTGRGRRSITKLTICTAMKLTG